MYLRKHLVDEMVEYLQKIQDEKVSGEPNNRRIGRYKGMILSILNENFVIFPETIFYSTLEAMEKGWDYTEFFKEKLQEYVDIIDKPKMAEVLPEYFMELNKEVYVLTAEKIIGNNGVCSKSSCFLCPFTTRNLSEEFKRYYNDGCVHFGKNTKRNLPDKELVVALKEFLKLSEK